MFSCSPLFNVSSHLCSIDTPGVINRVSTLFNGSQELIQGFNTFLPVGYRIDVSVDPSNPSTITVTTPQGTMTQNTNEMAIQTRSATETQGVSPSGPLLYPTPVPPLTTIASVPGDTLSRSHTPAEVYHIAPADQVLFDPNTPPGTYPPGQPPPSQASQQQQNAQVATAAAASFLGSLPGGRQPQPSANSNVAQVDTENHGQFNHAIQYLNKIKARYNDDQDTYKQFLDILQTYQKEAAYVLFSL